MKSIVSSLIHKHVLQDFSSLYYSTCSRRVLCFLRWVLVHSGSSETTNHERHIEDDVVFSTKLGKEEVWWKIASEIFSTSLPNKPKSAIFFGFSLHLGVGAREIDGLDGLDGRHGLDGLDGLHRLAVACSKAMRPSLCRPFILYALQRFPVLNESSLMRKRRETKFVVLRFHWEQ